MATDFDKQLFREGVIYLKNIFNEKSIKEILENNNFCNEERLVLPENSNLLNFFTHPSIVNCITLLLETDDYHLTTLSSNTLFPFVDKRSYHVDWPYHKYTSDSGDVNTIYKNRLDGVQVILPLDDFTIENGATMFIPYSHLARRYPSVDILKSGWFEAVDCKEKFVCKKKYLLGNVGDVFIYPSTLWHSQGLNITDTPRRALLANFSPKFIDKKDYL